MNLPVRLGTLAILARLLTPTDFGAFAAAVTVIEFARLVGPLSMDHALVQIKNLSASGIAFASVVSLALSSVVGAVVALNADAVLLLYDDPEVPPLLLALAVSIPLATASGLLLAMLRRRLVFRELSIIVVVSSVVGAAVSVLVAFTGGGVWSLVAGYYADLLLRSLFAAWLVRPRIARPRVGAEGRELLRFGGGTSLSLVLNFWALHGDYVVIGSALGSKPLGYYSRAYQLISTVPGMLGQLHTRIVFPAFSRAQSDRSYLAKALRVGTEATAALTLPLCAWGLVLGPELITVLLGPGWELTILPFQILSLGVYFRAAYNLSASIAWATGHVFSLSAAQGLYGALIVVGAIYGSQWGIPGVAAATLVALFVFYLALYVLAARITGAPFRSFAEVHARPLVVFLLVLSSAYLGRTVSLRLGFPALATLIVTVALGIATLAIATRILGRRLWGELVYEQGATLFRSYTSPANGDSDERDDGRA